ncbi:F-box/kelch-repeat protein At1g57790-like [Durio zibethinus]|uniref:F-box/kelch-repeat protein At1g57790-like n=1 Tax=Durio zibethinus TaxID=66656 RepID=A0A6P6AHN4_DURZI|nr:F-box/kelch-repeat protein At1g57790-like [Durio zibethinus]
MTSFAKSNTKNQPPLLFLLGEPNGETKHAFLDPVNQSPFLSEAEFPELQFQVECLSSGHGWLLLLSRQTSSLFFLNPFTRQKIDLPYRSSGFTAVAFSAPPTSPDCVVFAIQHQYEKCWNRYPYRVGKDFGVLMHAICNDGILYCMDSCGRIATFDANKKGDTWTEISSKNFKQVRLSCFFKFNGELYGVKLYGNYSAVETVYKLKLENGVAAAWEEVNDMRDHTMFLGPYGSCAAVGLDEKLLQKKIFLARDDPTSKCLIFDFDEGNYKKTATVSSSEYSWCYSSVWIERSAA